MTIKKSVFIATSLDGYIAREDGNIDWLNAANEMVTPGEDCGYQAFTADVDVLVMGRNSYETVLSFGVWPYAEMDVIVLSRNPIAFPAHLPKTVTHSAETPQALCERLAAAGVKKIYVDGGITIQRFLAAGLIDELIITTIPILLGAGIPLFGSLINDIALTHVNTTAYPFGFVQTAYQVNHPVAIDAA